LIKYLNKRAQTALGRSPRKRSKVTGKALGLVVSDKKIFERSILTPGANLNNFGRGPLDDVLYHL